MSIPGKANAGRSRGRAKVPCGVRQRAAAFRTAYGGAFAALFLAACGSPPHGESRPLVFVSLQPQAYVVERIAGDLIGVEAIAGEGADPHTFEPLPRQMARLGKARAYFPAGGMPFEQRLLHKVEAIYPNLLVLPVDGHPHDPAGHHHAGGASDPHTWLSPARLREHAQTIATALKQIAPEHTAAFDKGLAGFLADIDTVDGRIRARLEAYAGRSFYVFHPAFGHFAEAYGLSQKAVEREGKAPAPKQLAELIRRAKSGQVRTVFVQPQFDRRSAETAAQALGATTAVLDPLAKDVLANLEEIAKAVEAALRN